MSPEVFEKKYTIHVYETGPDGTLNVHSMFNFLQDIASEHAVRLGFGRDDLLRENHFWVLSRIYAEFHSWPSWEDTITVSTWPDGTQKLFALRNFKVNSEKGEQLAAATSSWLILDQTTRRIQRPDIFLKRFRNDLNPGTAPLRYPLKVESALTSGIESDRFKVVISDLDVNLHTNNVKYLKWVMDTYDLGFVLKNRPLSVEINYLAESIFGQEVFVRRSEDPVNKMAINHSIIRLDDNRELCTVRICWKESMSISK